MYKKLHCTSISSNYNSAIKTTKIYKKILYDMLERNKELINKCQSLSRIYDKTQLLLTQRKKREEDRIGKQKEEYRNLSLCHVNRINNLEEKIDLVRNKVNELTESKKLVKINIPKITKIKLQKVDNTKFNIVYNGVKYDAFELVYNNNINTYIQLFKDSTEWKINTFFKLYRSRCKIMIDNKIMDFRCKYRFNSIGTHKIYLLIRGDIENFNGLFFNCEDLVDISSLKYLNVNKCKEFYGMFWGCKKLQDISALKDWDVSEGQDFSWMFLGCTSLTDLQPLKDWNVSNGQEFNGIFTGCPGLKICSTSFRNKFHLT